MNLSEGSYWVIEIEERGEPGSIRRGAALRVAELTSLADLQHPGLILEKLYEGFVNSAVSSFFMPEGPLTLVARPVADPTDVATSLATDYQRLLALPSDRRERYQLAARWFRRGQETLNLVDKVLFWWTVLEVFPAQGSKKVVGKTCDLLSQGVYQNLDTATIKARSKLGHLHGLRSDIVHQGKAFVSRDEEDAFSDYLKRLQATVLTCLRLLIGIEPGTDLDEFVLASPAANAATQGAPE